MYQDIFTIGFTKKYFRKFPSEGILSTVWILQEHGVTNPLKPGKLRRVSNAKSKFKRNCLNDMLSPGPDLLSNLLAVICRFWERKDPINADIESKYMQISVKTKTRNFSDSSGEHFSQLFTSILVSFLALNARQFVRTSLSKHEVTTKKTITHTSKNLSTAVSTWTTSTSQPTPWKKHYNCLLYCERYSPQVVSTWLSGSLQTQRF